MIASRTFEDEFAYGFDDPIDTVSYSRAVRITGWLVNIKAQPIHGIRLIARNGLWPRRETRAWPWRGARARHYWAHGHIDLVDAEATHARRQGRLARGDRIEQGPQA